MAEEPGEDRSALEQRERDLEALQALYAHWERGDFDFADVFAEDMVWAPADALEAGEYTGVGEIKKAWRTWLQSWEPPFRIRATEIIPGTEGKYVVMQVFSGKGKSSGVESEESTGLVVTLREGKITRMEGYWDRDEAFRAASIEPR